MISGEAQHDERGFLGKFSLRDAPGWLISVGVHVVIMMFLLAVKISAQTVTESSLITSSLEDVQNEMEFEASAADQVGIGADVTTLSPTTASAASAGAAASGGEETQVARVDESIRGPEVRLNEGDASLMPSMDDLGKAVGGGASGPGVTGGGTENVSGEGVGGAIDRLTWEISAALREHKTTVVWLFDQSLSLKERRDMIAERFENVYRQLENLEDKDKERDKTALQTLAATYGEGFKMLTDKPVDDYKTLVPKVRAIPDDPSGKENVFAAVNQLVQRLKKDRDKKRTILIFIITDEKGDDAEKHLEDTIQVCRRQGIKIYTVGNGALFGREKGYVAWKYPNGEMEDIEVDAGPETVEPEALVLGFWGGKGPDLSRMSSGYGPYALTRLCKETGGQYLIAQEDTVGQKFDPAVMRSYQPDYRPIRDYVKSVEKNLAKASLVTAAKATKLENVPIPRLDFPAYNDNILRETITEAQKPAAELDFKLGRLLEALSKGEKDREKVSEVRWRAAYDLAIGRTLAMTVRAKGYNQMLAEMKATPKSFQKKDSNEWKIEPSKTINAGQNNKKLEKQASLYLKRVVDEHPGTPWAKLAERELSTPMGWEWKEANNPRVLAANTNPEEAKRQIRLADDEAKKEAAKKPMAAPREKPKL